MLHGGIGSWLGMQIAGLAEIQECVSCPTMPSVSLSEDACLAEESGASGTAAMSGPAPASMSNGAGLPYNYIMRDTSSNPMYSPTSANVYLQLDRVLQHLGINATTHRHVLQRRGPEILMLPASGYSSQHLAQAAGGGVGAQRR